MTILDSSRVIDSADIDARTMRLNVIKDNVSAIAKCWEMIAAEVESLHAWHTQDEFNAAMAAIEYWSSAIRDYETMAHWFIPTGASVMGFSA